MTLENGLTIKQAKFVEKFVENGGNGTQAALESYDVNGDNSAALIANENLRKPKIIQVLDKLGITDERLAKVMDEGLEATRTVSAQVIVKSDDPRVRNKTATARDVDFIDVPDYGVRHKYMDTALKLKGHLKKDEMTINNTVVVPILGGTSVQANDGDKEASSTQETNPSNPGGDSSEQDDIDSLIAD